jgi:hypothetical protein
MRRLLALLAFGGLATITASAALASPVNHGPPNLDGVAVVGGTLTASPGSWTGNGSISYAYAWLICDNSGSACKPLTKLDGSQILGPTLHIPPAAGGHSVRAVVTAMDQDGSSSAMWATSRSPLPHRAAEVEGQATARRSAW